MNNPRQTARTTEYGRALMAARRAAGKPAAHIACRLRRDDRPTAAGIAVRLRLPRSTVARWLRQAGLGQAGLGRLSSPDPRRSSRRYRRDRPGERIHLDVRKLDRPGRRAAGARTGRRNRDAGWGFIHVAIDAAGRLA